MNPISGDGVKHFERLMQRFQEQIDALSVPEDRSRSPFAMNGNSAFGNEFVSAMGGDVPMNPANCVIGGSNTLSGQIGGTSQEYRDLAKVAALKHGLDPSVFDALIQQESSWNPSAISKDGAMGLCQLMPKTADGLGVKNPFDPAENIEGGAKYFRQMMDRFDGDTRLALAAYNAGPTRIQKLSPADWPAETKGYVRNILMNSGGST